MNSDQDIYMILFCKFCARSGSRAPKLHLEKHTSEDANGHARAESSGAHLSAEETKGLSLPKA